MMMMAACARLNVNCAKRGEFKRKCMCVRDRGVGVASGRFGFKLVKKIAGSSRVGPT
jgi:hypothetical protein